MAEEESTACADLIYRSQHKRNITQVLLAERKIVVLRGREEDLIQSPPPPHAGQGWISPSHREKPCSGRAAALLLSLWCCAGAGAVQSHCWGG